MHECIALANATKIPTMSTIPIQQNTLYNIRINFNSAAVLYLNIKCIFTQLKFKLIMSFGFPSSFCTFNVKILTLKRNTISHINNHYNSQNRQATHSISLCINLHSCKLKGFIIFHSKGSMISSHPLASAFLRVYSLQAFYSAHYILYLFL